MDERMELYTHLKSVFQSLHPQFALKSSTFTPTFFVMLTFRPQARPLPSRLNNSSIRSNPASSSSSSNRCMASVDHVWALDFDGVVCDSVGESSLSAWKAASKLWPDIFTTRAAESQKEALVEKMRAVRPVVETGYENIVQIRCLLEGITVDNMLNNWITLLPYYMTKWQLDRGYLVDLFGSTRDEWMAEDLDDWLAPNRIYTGVPEIMNTLINAPNCEVYIVTTKQARFTETILKRMAGIDFPIERIFSQTVSGRPKSEVLLDLQNKHPEASSSSSSRGGGYHFVEDKMSTLDKVEKIPELGTWNLYLVDWGYNTAKERAAAAANPRIQLVDVESFRSITASKSG